MKTRKLFALLLLLFAISVLSPLSVPAKDQWLHVRSKNFNLIGNASEKDIRRVATRLEQFRETFRQIFGQAILNSPIPTNVVVFKSNSAYKPFKPIRADGKVDNFVAGYFQPGEDVNYITLSTEGEDSKTFETIFHEYVHFIVNTNYGKSEVPPWFNEGLAEYYSTFAIEDDQKVKLGLLQEGHLALLAHSGFIPLDELFKVSNYQLLQQGDHSRNIFYAESWALVHYLLQGGRVEGMGKFLNDSMNDVPPRKAFQEAFQITYDDMEKELRAYVSQQKYKYQIVVFPKKLVFDADMQVSPLAEAETDAYLGDLLFHTDRVDEAAAYLQTALTLKPDLSMANTAMGMVKVRQRKYDEAKPFLDKAIAEDQKNHLALYQYAYLLTREGRDTFGYVSAFSAGQSAKMRELLKKSIALNPSFTQSYELLAFVDLVNNEFLDEAVAYLRTALKYQPGNQRYALRIAEIYLRQNKLTEAGAIAEKIAKTSDDPGTKADAESLTADLRRRAQAAERNAKNKNGDGTLSYGSVPTLVQRGPGGKPLTPEEIAKGREEAEMRSLNSAVGKPPAGEKQIIGSIQRIDCRKGIVYNVKAGSDVFTLTSKDFQTLTLRAYVSGGDSLQVGCGEDVSAFNAVLTYKPLVEAKSSSRGELIAVTFVPKNFRFIDISVPQVPPDVSTIEEPPPKNEAEQAQDHSAMMQVIKDNMRRPVAGEKRAIGLIERSECTAKGSFFYLRTASGILKLSSSAFQKLPVRAFTAEIENVRFGCGMKPLDISVVFIYTDVPDAKSGTAGELVSLEFVPKEFVLD